MSKFIVGQNVKLNAYYLEEGKRIFGEKWEPQVITKPIQDIYEDGIHEPIYWFDQKDRDGGKMGFAESFLEAV